MSYHGYGADGEGDVSEDGTITTQVTTTLDPVIITGAPSASSNVPISSSAPIASASMAGINLESALIAIGVIGAVVYGAHVLGKRRR